jgi:uncharacterized damage-inducible protein DinB
MADITMDALRAATRRFVRGETTPEAEGAKYTIPELAAALRMTRGKLQEIAEGWSQAQLRTRPPEGAASDIGEDSWSATETLTHMMATQNWYQMNMDRILGRRRQFEQMPRGLGDRTDNTVPNEELAGRLRAATESFLADIDAIPADADLAATRESHFFGPLSLRGWIFLALTHDTMHLGQIERLKGYPTFPAN